MGNVVSTKILMPALSATMEEGKIAKWHVKEVDAVKAGDILAEIETDKATMEFEAVDEGRIGKILVPEGAEGVKVNAPIATLLGGGESFEPGPSAGISSAMKAIRDAMAPTAPPKPQPAHHAPAPAPRAEAAPPAKPAAPPPPSPSQTAPQTAPAQQANGARIFASPLARRLAQVSGVRLESLTGSGPRGRIVKADVEAALKAPG